MAKDEDTHVVLVFPEEFNNNTQAFIFSFSKRVLS
jgi:hypothetical protein